MDLIANANDKGREVEIESDFRGMSMLGARVKK